jgi:2-iminobutanoate/2-iminopropanoate deaminase
MVGAGLVFCSGQIALDPATGEMVRDSIEDETRRCMENLRAILEAAGSDLAHVLKATIFLTNMDDFARVNAVYVSYFQGFPAPARACVGVFQLPRGARVEVECVALCPDPR